MEAILVGSTAKESFNKAGVTLTLEVKPLEEPIILHLSRYQGKALMRRISDVLDREDERRRCTREVREDRLATRVSACSTVVDRDGVRGV